MFGEFLALFLQLIRVLVSHVVTTEAVHPVTQKIGPNTSVRVPKATVAAAARLNVRRLFCTKSVAAANRLAVT